MVRSIPSRKAFARRVKDLVARLQLDGIDLNWEYPGYVFGRGYSSDKEIEKDYYSFGELIKLLRRELGAEAAITLAYYPDGRQERMLVRHGSPESLDLLHMMTYDQPGQDHSSFAFARKSMLQGIELGLPKEKLTLGLPFYGRNSQTGDWTTYEDIVQKYRISDADDSVRENGIVIGFNGKDTIRRKTEEALRLGLGGVMVWEAGQDCRGRPVARSGRTHVATCPQGEESSLLAEIDRAVKKRGGVGAKGAEL
jgi:GH18 family chitinase